MHKYIERLFNTGLHDINPGLEMISRFLGVIGSPHNRHDYIIVGGTNGKFSVANTIASILQNSGYRTGLYTSPHLVDVTERFRINGINIEKERLNEILGYIFSTCDENEIPLSFFELVSTAAFIYFNEENIDIGILEVGMGGRWDATNVIDPLVSIITNVSYDHMNFLGNFLHEIASEKAGIMKSNGIAVTGAKGVSLDVIRKTAGTRNCKLYVMNEDFSCRPGRPGNFDYFGIFKNYPEMDTKLKGIHQINNIAISMACIELLIYHFKYMSDEDTIRSSVDSISLEGRLEYLREDPPLIMDGAHNEAAAAELVRSLQNIHGRKKFVFLIAMLSDKDHVSYIKNILPVTSRIIITQLPEKRCMKAKELFDKVSQLHEGIEVIEDPVYAFESLIENNQPLCITGSLYLIGYLKERIKNAQNRPGN